MEQREIRAVWDDKRIRVYQAYNPAIAEEAVRLGRFGSHFKLDRMTWIKPSFLWMMYRCCWAEKEGQERVLAVDLCRPGFDGLVRGAVPSSFSGGPGLVREDWQRRVKLSDVRCQWDPEKDVNGRNLEYRSLQLGLRGEAVRRYVGEWTLGIEDITPYVKELNAKRRLGEDIAALLPEERVYLPK